MAGELRQRCQYQGIFPPLLGKLDHDEMKTNSAAHSPSSGFVHLRRKATEINEQLAHTGPYFPRSESRIAWRNSMSSPEKRELARLMHRITNPALIQSEKIAFSIRPFCDGMGATSKKYVPTIAFQHTIMC